MKAKRAAAKRYKVDKPSVIEPLPPQMANPVLVADPLAPKLDYPAASLPLASETRASSKLTFPIQHLPWADSLPIEEVQRAMIEADTERSLKFVEALRDPINLNVPLSVVAMRCGIRVPELMDVWRNHQRVATLGVILSQAPLVAADVMEDARTRIVCCSRCDGSGVMRVQVAGGESEWRACIDCEGTGRMRKVGDTKSREWALRASGAIASSEAPAITINMQRVDSVLDELDRLDRAVDVTAEK